MGGARNGEVPAQLDALTRDVADPASVARACEGAGRARRHLSRDFQAYRRRPQTPSRAPA
jgi:transcriptional regulator GlxA family with amidase domain